MPPRLKSIITLALYTIGVLVNVIEFYYPRVRSQGKEIFTTWWIGIQLFQQRYPDMPRYIWSTTARRLFDDKKVPLALVMCLSAALALVPVLFFLLVPSQSSVIIAGKTEPFPQPDAIAYIFMFLFLAVPSLICCSGSTAISLVLFNWVDERFSVVRLFTTVVAGSVIACIAVIINMVVFLLLVPFWLLPGSPEDFLPLRHDITFGETRLGRAALHIGVLYIVAASVPIGALVFMNIGGLLLRTIQKPVFILLVNTLEGFQRTQKWLVAMTINITVVVWTVYLNWIKILGNL